MKTKEQPQHVRSEIERLLRWEPGLGTVEAAQRRLLGVALNYHASSWTETLDALAALSEAAKEYARAVEASSCK